MFDLIEMKVFMTRKGIASTKELAEKIGVAPSTLGRWLEKNDMPTSAVDKISEVLSIPREFQAAIFFAPLVARHATYISEQSS